MACPSPDAAHHPLHIPDAMILGIGRQLTQHMQHAVDSHDSAAIWKYARLLSAKHIGPHGRVYN
eukprot:3456939-Heterocapsa_arctica.AAC.1